MAVEKLRRAGYRIVGATYLCSDTFFREEHEIPVCKYCGQGPNLSRNITEINCGDLKGSFLMIVGKHFYPTIETFIQEAEELGVSKRVPFVAKKIKLGIGNTKIYLAHPLAKKRDWGIFGFFFPERVEKLVWSKDYNDEYSIKYTIIRVPDGDLDHSSWKQKKLLKIGSD